VSFQPTADGLGSEGTEWLDSVLGEAENGEFDDELNSANGDKFMLD